MVIYSGMHCEIALGCMRMHVRLLWDHVRLGCRARLLWDHVRFLWDAGEIALGSCEIALGCMWMHVRLLWDCSGMHVDACEIALGCRWMHVRLGVHVRLLWDVRMQMRVRLLLLWDACEIALE